MDKPLVSCIMPTANRPNFVVLSIEGFLNQDFRNVELVIIDDGKESVRHVIPEHKRVKYFYTEPLGTIGNKRNFACSKAEGEIIMHWDDDDWYAHDWISKSIQFLENSDCDICGLNQIIFYSPLWNKFWKYEGKTLSRPFLSGATMAYRKLFWEQHPFKDVQIGEDYDYIWNTGAVICAHNYTDGFIATLHNSNTTIKPFEDPRHKRKDASNWMNINFKGKTESPEKSRYNY